MELTRRDALAALAAVGAGGAAVGGTSLLGDGEEGAAPTADEPPEAAVLDTLTAAAEVLFPSEVTGHRAFVETYVLGRVEGREDYRAGLVDAATDLDDVARDWQGDAFAKLDPAVRDRLLRDLGVETAEPDPAGPISERIRYYVVNDLLFAFYSSPVGGELVGIENPIGHPGGTESYQRASMDGDGGDTDG